MNVALTLMTREISQHLTRPSCPKNETVCQSGRENRWKLTAFRSGFQLSRGPSTNLPALASLRPLHSPSKCEASPNLSPAAFRNVLRASAYKLQRNSTCSAVSSPRPHSHAGLSASFFLNRQALSPQCSLRACTRIKPSEEDSAP
jgi:hypothetical protein